METIIQEMEAAGQAVPRDAFGHVKLDAVNPGKWFGEQFAEMLGAEKVLNPPLTTMAQPQSNSGREICDMLLAIIDGGNPVDYQELRRAKLVRRMSDGPVRP